MIALLTSPSILTIVGFIVLFAFLNYLDKGRVD